MLIYVMFLAYHYNKSSPLRYKYPFPSLEEFLSRVSTIYIFFLECTPLIHEDEIGCQGWELVYVYLLNPLETCPNSSFSSNSVSMEIQYNQTKLTLTEAG